MQILAVVQGVYGKRIADNLEAKLAPGWTFSSWRAPAVLPPVIDYPEEFLPDTMPPADLLLSLGEHPGVAELLPEIASLCGARSVLAPVDNLAWLPTGLMHQAERWLNDQKVSAVFPKPFCSLTETTIGFGRQRTEYQNPTVSEFARHFGRPRFKITYDAYQERIVQVQVDRDTPCGCACSVATGLVGISADQAEQEAGMLHHHYPCFASMDLDPAYNDTLMHVSGNILKGEVVRSIETHRQPPPYLRPGDKSN